MDTQEFQLIYEGPVDDSPETIRRLKGVFIADLELSSEEVQRILSEAPAVIRGAADQKTLEPIKRALSAAGGRVLIVTRQGTSDGSAQTGSPLLDLEKELWAHANAEGNTGVSATPLAPQSAATETSASTASSPRASEDEVTFEFNLDLGSGDPVQEEEEPKKPAKSEQKVYFIPDEPAGEDLLAFTDDSQESPEPAAAIPTAAIHEIPAENPATAQTLETESEDGELSVADLAQLVLSEIEQEIPPPVPLAKTPATPSASAQELAIPELNLSEDDDTELAFDLQETPPSPPAAPRPELKKVEDDNSLSFGLDDSPPVAATPSPPPSQSSVPAAHKGKTASGAIIPLTLSLDEVAAPIEAASVKPAAPPPPPKASTQSTPSMSLQVEEPEAEPAKPPLAESPTAPPQLSSFASAADAILDKIVETVSEELEVTPAAEPKVAPKQAPKAVPQVPAEESPSAAAKAEPRLEAAKESAAPTEANPAALPQAAPPPAAVQEAKPSAESTPASEETAETQEEAELEVVPKKKGGSRSLGKLSSIPGLDVIVPIIIGVVLLGFGNWYYFSSQQEADEEESARIAMVKIKNEQKKKAKAAQPQPTAAPELKTFKGSAADTPEGLSLSLTFSGDLPSAAKVSLAFPQPSPRTNEEFAQQILKPWAKKIEGDKFEFTEKDGSFEGQGPVKIYIDVEDRSERVVTQATIRGTSNKDQNTVEATVEILRGIEAPPADGAAFAKMSPTGEFSIYFSGKVLLNRELPAPPAGEAGKAPAEPAAGAQEDSE